MIDSIKQSSDFINEYTETLREFAFKKCNIDRAKDPDLGGVYGDETHKLDRALRINIALQAKLSFELLELCFLNK